MLKQSSTLFLTKCFIFLLKGAVTKMSIFRTGLFSGKVALVTGGATGIGRAISNELLSLGEFYWNSLQTILLFGSNSLNLNLRNVRSKGRSYYRSQCNHELSMQFLTGLMRSPLLFFNISN